MTRRLLLALLGFWLVLPSLAAPHPLEAQELSAQASSANAHDCHAAPDTMPADHEAQRHECIGCITPICGVAAPSDLGEMRGIPPLQALVQTLRSHLDLPDLPPPRR